MSRSRQFEPHMLVTSRSLRDVSQEPRVLRDEQGDRTWTMVRHGVCIRSSDWTSLGTDDRHRAFVHACALMARSGPPLFSHYSAAAVWGIPVADPWPRKVHVLVRDSTRASRSGLVVRREDEECAYVERDGLRVTPPSRTVLDLTRDTGLLNGLVAADHAVRHGLCSRRELVAEVERVAPGTPGRSDCGHLVELVDPVSASPGESLSRGQMFLLRFPRPRLQVPHHDGQGLIGYVDFQWEGVVGEFDGASKYGTDFAQTPEEMQETLVREKVREDRLRATGTRVARWLWDDAFVGVGMARALHAQGVRQSPRRIWVEGVNVSA
ncbi:hypothetical protein PZ938_15725 [Luteipulveratus sp. YIM 133132]|uniref:hypothetical protein n=1 Tax=Luteipulveratus flavus TaxID=3031728 RepID=UPI0023B1ED3F|nr:hypothetical protein [Luteipulveratus sp. YIM 133132]MDE9367066.1 hypothetical protein [Luteipulveratus sp. YIM 133132]